MKCSLLRLIQALKTEFPLETCGELDLQITDIQELTQNNPLMKSDVLYTIQQNQLLHYDGPVAQGPVMCIAHRNWELRHSQATFPTLIMVPGWRPVWSFS